jgi:zinc transport system substrate-binding protein
MVFMFTVRRTALLTTSVLILLAGCGSAGAGPGGQPEASRLQVLTSFYPLQWATEQIAGARADVGSLTKPGAEPHDLELGPRDIAEVAEADLVVFLGGFQPAVDDAVASEGSGRSLDVSKAARLDLVYRPIEEGEQHGHEATDPHFWLDPTRLASVADAIEARLANLDPAHASDYQQNLTALRNRLDQLDGAYRAGLAHCANRDLVTSHNAFGYLARRYGLTQVGITGLTPDAEPRPADLAAVTGFVRANDIRTIYYETLVSPRIAKAVASETGAATAVLDPIEGLTAKSAGRDYLGVMRANLAALQAGQPCR